MLPWWSMLSLFNIIIFHSWLPVHRNLLKCFLGALYILNQFLLYHFLLSFNYRLFFFWFIGMFDHAPSQTVIIYWLVLAALHLTSYILPFKILCNKNHWFIFCSFKFTLSWHPWLLCKCKFVRQTPALLVKPWSLAYIRIFVNMMGDCKLTYWSSGLCS